MIHGRSMARYEPRAPQGNSATPLQIRTSWKRARFGTCVFLLLFTLPPSAAADALSPDSTTTVNLPEFPEWVRVRTPVQIKLLAGQRPKKVQGYFLGETADSIRVERRENGREAFVLRTQVSSLDVSWEYRPRTGRGALVGLLVGGALGAVLGASTDESEVDDPGAVVAGAALGFGFLGAWIGAFVGAGAQSDRWYQVYPTAKQLQVPVPAGAEADSTLLGSSGPP